jgi:hypothetical protein
MKTLVVLSSLTLLALSVAIFMDHLHPERRHVNPPLPQCGEPFGYCPV